jgi:hypothetical protein
VSHLKPEKRKRGRPIGVPGRFRSVGEGIIWPKGIEARYNISRTTRWAWEQQGKLPPRDVRQGPDGPLIGWRPETLDAWDRGERVAA